MDRPKKRITGPAVLALPVADAKAHMNIDSTFTIDDDLIESYIMADIDYCEKYMVRKLINQTWKLWLDFFPSSNAIIMPFGNLTSVTSIKYTDTNDDQTTFSTDNYSVDTNSVPGRIVLNFGKSWPSAQLGPLLPIEIEFVSGYGAAAANITDEMIIHALKMMVAHYYENREPLYISTNSNTVTPLEKTVDSLLYPHRIWKWIL